MQVLKKADVNEAREQLYVLDRNQKPISETKRFAILTLGLFTMVCGSFGSYTYNLVSGDLQEMYSLSQRDSTVITTCGTVVGYAVLPYAIVYDYFGPLPISILSIVVFPLGALLTALCFQGVIAGTVVKLCVFYSFMNVGTTYYDLICTQTVISYFPTRRGYVTALLKCFVGLGASLTGSMNLGFFPDSSSFFYFLMVYAVICAVLCCFFMHSPPYIITNFEERRLSEEEKEKRRATKAPYLNQEPQMVRFYIGIGILLFLIAYTVTTSALVNYLDLNHKYEVAFAIITVIGWASFLLLIFPYYPCGRQKRQANLDEQENSNTLAADEPANDSDQEKKEEQVVIAGTVHGDNDGGIDDGVDSPYKPSNDQMSKGESEEKIETEVDFIAPQYQTSFWRNLLSLNLWSLFWTQFVVLGTESMIMNNSSYIFASLTGESVPDSLRTLLSVLNGAGSAFGRLLMSGFEMFTQNRGSEKRVPITLCLFFPSSSVLITLVLLLTLPMNVLPLPYVLGAMGNGFLSASTLLVTRTIFAKDNAKHYNFLFLSTACSAIAINRFLYGEWYTVHADGVLVCLQRKCVQTPLIICLALCATSFASNAIVHFRYRAFCKLVIKERQELRRGNQRAEDGEEEYILDREEDMAAEQEIYQQSHQQGNEHEEEMRSHKSTGRNAVGAHI